MPFLSEDYLRQVGVPIDDVSAAGIALPSAEDWGSNLQAMPGAGLEFQALTALQNAVLQSETTRATMGAIGVNVGIPVVAMINSLAQALGVNIRELLEEAINELLAGAIEASEAAIKEVVTTAFDALEIQVNFMASIPVYGYIVELVWNLAKAIKGLIDILDAQKKAEKAQQIEYEIPGYVPEHDVAVFNAALFQIRDTWDWTRIWQPPTLGESAGHGGARFGILDLVGDAFVAQGLVETGGAGCVPGVGWVHRSILYQTKPVVRAVDTGTFLPSIRQQHAYLWKQFTRNNADLAGETGIPSLTSIYCIDAEKLEAQWAQYVHDLWVWLHESSIKQSVIDRIQAEYAGSPERPFYGMDLSYLPEDDDIANVQCVRECTIVRERQRALLNTPIVAYLDRDMVALSTNTQLRSVWEERKQQLLEHPARCRVSLDDVPDTIYYQYLTESGVGTPQCQTITDIAVAGPFTDDPEEIPQGTDDTGPTDEGGKGKKRKRGMGAAPLVLGAVALGFAATR